MKKVLLITKGFPLGDSERCFLDAEYQHMNMEFELYILAVTQAKNNDLVPKVTIFSDYRPEVIELINQWKYKEVRSDIWNARNGASVFDWIRRSVNILKYSAHADHVQNILLQLIEENGIDLIYTFWCMPATVAALRLKNKRKDIRVISRFHGVDLYQYRAVGSWQPLRQYISDLASNLVFACDYAQDYYIRTFSCDKGKCIRIYLGTGKRRYIQPSIRNKIVIISVSAVVPIKRVELISKCIGVASQYLNIEWHHVGAPITMFPHLNGTNVTYIAHGQVANESITALYEEILPDLFITLSSTEGGAPVSIQEAFSMGVPAIGTHVGGIPELISDGVNGYVVSDNPGVEEVVKKIREYASLSLSKRIKMSENAYKVWALKFNSDNNAEEIVKTIYMM